MNARQKPVSRRRIADRRWRAQRIKCWQPEKDRQDIATGEHYEHYPTRQ